MMIMMSGSCSLIPLSLYLLLLCLVFSTFLHRSFTNQALLKCFVIMIGRIEYSRRIYATFLTQRSRLSNLNYSMPQYLIRPTVMPNVSNVIQFTCNVSLFVVVVLVVFATFSSPFAVYSRSSFIVCMVCVIIL